MSNKQNTDQQQFWQMVMETFKSSPDGIGVRNFCKQEGLSEPAFYSWRKKLTKSDEPKKDKQKDANSSAFIEVSMPSEKPHSLELLLSSGNSLRIGSGTDSQTLSNVITALRQAGLC